MPENNRAHSSWDVAKCNRRRNTLKPSSLVFYVLKKLKGGEVNVKEQVASKNDDDYDADSEIERIIAERSARLRTRGQ
ncbi:hypothetical protein V6N13_117113 [Hibiscus sabdariffa]